MKKTVIVAMATAFLGSSALIPTPASAMFFLLPVVLMAKKDPNFHAQTPQAKKVVRHHRRAKKHM